jgi:hypothetical protein
MILSLKRPRGSGCQGLWLILASVHLQFVTGAFGCSSTAPASRAGTTSSPAAPCSGAVSQARKYDEGAQCLGPLEQVGCSTEERECSFIRVAAKGPDGTCWQFPDDCLPPEFEPAAECEGPASAPLCDANL